MSSRASQPGRHLVPALGALAAVTAAGTLGYVLVAGASPLDALYMTVITLSTVGYDEIVPLDGGGRLFTVGLIVAGVGTTFYAIGALAEYLIAGGVLDVLGQRRTERMLGTVRDHTIVCGYGRLGRAVAEELAGRGAPVVVIEANRDLEPALAEAGHLYRIGSALEERCLEAAGVHRARTLVAAIGSEADNVFVTLAARELNPQLVIHARAESEGGIRRLRLAGAAQVISPYLLGGHRIANAILRPAVVDFIELTTGPGAEVDLEEIVIAEGSPLVGRRLRDLPEQGVRALVVAIRRGEASLRLGPTSEETLAAGDHVVVVGEPGQLARLAALAAAP